MSFFEQVRVASVRSSGEAVLLRAAFEQEGIPVEIRGAHLADELPLPGVEVTLWVEPRDEHRARALLRRFELAAQAGVTPCARCGEENPANFEICWNCQGHLERVG
jgi:hypothetical protein